MIKITWLEHACFTLDDSTQKIVIAPFLTGNPVAAGAVESLNAAATLVIHGHDDHLGKAIPLARRCRTLVNVDHHPYSGRFGETFTLDCTDGTQTL